MERLDENERHEAEGRYDDDFRELIARAAEAGVPIEDMVGGHTKTIRENFGIPLLFTFDDDQRVVRYRQRDGVVQLFDGAPPSEGVWIECDVRMTLKKALRLYGSELLAFERVHRVTTLDITGMSVRKRVEITTRLLVRKSLAGRQAS